MELVLRAVFCIDFTKTNMRARLDDEVLTKKEEAENDNEVG